MFVFLNSMIESSEGTNNNNIKPMPAPIPWIMEETDTTSLFSFTLKIPDKIPASIAKNKINTKSIIDIGKDTCFHICPR